MCCIPLYIYGIALGDLITLSDGSRSFPSVVRRCGNYAYRIWFGGSQDEFNREILPASHDYVHEVIDELLSRNARTEFGSKNLLAVDAARTTSRKGDKL